MVTFLLISSSLIEVIALSLWVLIAISHLASAGLLREVLIEALG